MLSWWLHIDEDMRAVAFFSNSIIVPTELLITDYTELAVNLYSKHSDRRYFNCLLLIKAKALWSERLISVQGVAAFKDINDIYH